MISVIVPVHNGMPWLEDQLEALAAQQCPLSWEVVVADNGSTDRSRSFAERFAATHENFRVIDASSVKGAPAARNAGVRAAAGDRLAFCDADDVVQPGWLSSFAKALDEVDVVAGVFDFWSLNGLRVSPDSPASMRQLGFLPAGLGANLAVRRRAFEDIEGFAEELLVGEDIDLSWRLQLAGYRFVIDFDARVAKRERPQFMEVFRQAAAYGRSGPALYRRYRDTGARRNLRGAIKSWVWLVGTAPGLVRPGGHRLDWARAAGMRSGRLSGSLREGVFFP
ncbi:MAG: glycosyltransferase [Acidimicrobiales bacterium]|nr:glycosyltransferase [Acidimicrobiales bacterium]